MDKKTKIFLICTLIFVTSALVYEHMINKDIDKNKEVVVGSVTGKWSGKGPGTIIGIDLYYKGNILNITSSINTTDWRLYEIGSCYEVEISSKNPKHCRITPKQVPCP